MEIRQNDLKVIMKKIFQIYHNVYGSDIVDVLLYGSYARGDFDRESDMDFVAIVKGERLELQRKLKSVWKESNELSLEYEIVLSPTVMPYNEFIKWNKDLPYYSSIEKEGVRIAG